MHGWVGELLRSLFLSQDAGVGHAMSRHGRQGGMGWDGIVGVEDADIAEEHNRKVKN